MFLYALSEKTESRMDLLYLYVRTFISVSAEQKGVSPVGGLPWGDSSLVEYTVVGADVAAEKGYSVVSVVRPGVISCDISTLISILRCGLMW